MFVQPFLTRSIAILVATIFSTTCLGQGTRLATQAIDRAVAEQMKEQQIVGMAIGIIRDSRIAYVKGYGFADLETQTPATDWTIYNWASNSKPVIAVAAMQLVQNEQLILDEPIGTYLSELPDHLKPVTTRQLLCHQSGIPHYRNGKVIPSGTKVNSSEEIDPAKSLHRFINSPLIFDPGSRTDYSSYAYVLLSTVVQAAGQQPVNHQLLERIGKPVGFQSFQLDMPFDNQPNWTTAYFIRRGSPQKVGDNAHFWKHGAGGYKSNVQDFARFALALMKQDLIDAETTKIMWTPQPLKNGDVSNYGLGVAINGSGQNLKVSHNGSQDETRTRMVIYPEQKHGIVIMCNTQGVNPGKITTAIYAAINSKSGRR